MLLSIENTNSTQLVSLNWIKNLPKPTAIPIGGPLIDNFIDFKDFCNPKTRIQKPEGAISIEDEVFTAFSFPTKKGSIGFIRIPHYAPFNEETGEMDAGPWLKAYEGVLAEFNKTSMGLIIDQDYNCGGSVAIVHQMVSYFAEEEFPPTKFSFRASEKQLSIMNFHLNEYYNPKSIEFKHFNYVVKQIGSSIIKNDFLTPRIPLWGFYDYALDTLGNDKIKPHKVQYTKPVVLLINEVSASGGDLFPAMMKDLGLAKLMGQATAGAGGHIYDKEEDPFELKHSKVRVKLTRSLFYTPNGDYIENNGVKPHHYYEVTRDDILFGYQDYFSEAVAYLLEDI